MRRFQSSLLLGVLCALSLWGCGPSANTLTEKPWFKRGPSRQELAEDNPLRRRTDAKPPARQSDEELAEATPGSKLSDRNSKSELGQLSKFDPETLHLIEEEMANMPVEERRQFYQDIVSLQPAMVRQIIHTRRIVRQVGQDAPNRFVAPNQILGMNQSGIQQVSGEQYAEELPSSDHADSAPSVIGREPGRDPGLGAADPWNRPTQSQSPAASGGWTNDPNRPPSELPFNQIPAISGTGHSAGYGPGQRNLQSNNPVQLDARNLANRIDNAPPQIQPPPGGALSPVNNPRTASSNLRNMPRSAQDARIPNDYNPQAPPVPNYGQNGNDPFGGNPPIRTANSNPNQPLPGVRNSLTVGDSFAPPASAPQGLTAGGLPGNPELSRLIAVLESELASMRYSDQLEPNQKTNYVQKHVYLRMLYLMAGQEAKAVTAIPEIAAADQEFWQQTFWAMSNYFDTNGMPDSDYRATQTVAQLRTAIQKLQEQARLELRNVAFCHKISSFGNFERFPQDEFGPGQPVLVYAEVVNFKSKPTTQPEKPKETVYQTQLKSSIEIHRLGPSGELVERFDFEPTEDFCHSHRRDYFHSYEFTIPQRISLGPHVMTLTVQDQLNQKVATYRLNFMVR